jgi:hypothetical protein
MAWIRSSEIGELDSIAYTERRRLKASMKSEVALRSRSCVTVGMGNPSFACVDSVKKEEATNARKKLPNGPQIHVNGFSKENARSSAISLATEEILVSKHRPIVQV